MYLILKQKKELVTKLIPNLFKNYTKISKLALFTVQEYCLPSNTIEFLNKINSASKNQTDYQCRAL